MAGTDLERPKLGLVSTLVIGALGVFGALLVLSWVIGTIFSLVRVVVLLAIVVAVVSLLLRRR